MRSFFSKIGAAVSVVVMVALTSVQANAALPTEADTAFSAILTDAQALEALAWPTLIGITTIFIVMKLFKRAANKAS